MITSSGLSGSTLTTAGQASNGSFVISVACPPLTSNSTTILAGESVRLLVTDDGTPLSGHGHGTATADRLYWIGKLVPSVSVTTIVTR